MLALIPVAAVGALYVLAWRRVEVGAGRGGRVSDPAPALAAGDVAGDDRGAAPASAPERALAGPALPVVPRWRAACFLGGLLAVGTALAPGVERLAHELLTAHMAQHVLLVLVAPPLLVLGAPMRVVPLVLPRRMQVGARRLHRVTAGASRRLGVAGPLLAAGVHAVVLWTWHAPGLYEAALRQGLVHAAEHLVFLATASWLWASALGSVSRTRATAAGGVLALFLTSVQSAVLGALFVFSGRVWYPTYAEGAARHGVDPLLDQQVAGMVMWGPGGAVYAGAAAVLLVLWLRRLDEPRVWAGDRARSTVP